MMPPAFYWLHPPDHDNVNPVLLNQVRQGKLCATIALLVACMPTPAQASSLPEPAKHARQNVSMAFPPLQTITARVGCSSLQL